MRMASSMSLEADDRRHRAEGFFLDQQHLGVHLVEHGGRIQRAAALVAHQQLRALGHGLVHARLEQLRGRLVDHGAHVVGLVHRVAVGPGAGLGHHLLHERSATASCTSMRLMAVQRWPEFLYEPATASVEASSMSASSITMIGSLPPSSSTMRR
jgi:hypothetical protein